MKLLGFDINIARQNIIENDIFDKRALVVFLVVKLLYIGERYRQHLGEHFSHLVLTLDKNSVFGLHVGADRTVCVSAFAYHVRRIEQIVAQTRHKFPYSYKLRTGNDIVGFVDNSYRAVNGILHLMNYALK